MANRAPEKKKNSETHPRFVSSIVFSSLVLIRNKRRNVFNWPPLPKQVHADPILQKVGNRNRSTGDTLLPLRLSASILLYAYMKKERINQATITRLLLPSIIYHINQYRHRHVRLRVRSKSLSLSLSLAILAFEKSSRYKEQRVSFEKSNEEDTTRPARFTARSRRRSGVTSDP